jgi:tRNA pseudouridine38-40 synthase
MKQLWKRMNAPKALRTQILVRFGYDGARFHGLQPQAPGIVTAGGALRDRLSDAGQTAPKALHFAARTDAGVHAERNAATCYFYDVADVPGLLAAIMRERDDGLKGVRAYEVPMWVHARGSSRGKRYRYAIEHTSSRPTLKEDRARDAWCVAPALDVSRMQRAAAFLLGRHDFSSLKSPRCTAREVEKTLSVVDVRAMGRGERGERVCVEIVGDAFLRQMVRNIVALLVEVGASLRAPEDVTVIVAARDRAAAGLCAPPEGLVLADVGMAWPEDGSALIPELRP